jgi:hypothetical protein
LYIEQGFSFLKYENIQPEKNDPDSGHGSRVIIDIGLQQGKAGGNGRIRKKGTAGKSGLLMSLT